MENKKRLAVILMNLGGPDSLEAVKPFLFNLFQDPKIIPFPLENRGVKRFINKFYKISLSFFISTLRHKKAMEIYKKIGNKSPLLENTNHQARSLEKTLKEYLVNWDVRCFIAMRYWHPFTEDTFKAVEDFKPHKIILLPLYPQFSHTTAASSLEKWYDIAPKEWHPFTEEINCYGPEEGFVQANLHLLEESMGRLETHTPRRLLFSAHGLPQRNIEKGDPYQWQVEKTASQLIETLIQKYPHFQDENIFDYEVCYQSKVGKLAWLEPSLEQAMKKAAVDKRGVIIVPLSFVSEHSETLVELDRDYWEYHKDLGLPFYIRVSTVMTHPFFIKGLSQAILKKMTGEKTSPCFPCPEGIKMCWCRQKEEHLKGGM